MPDTWIDPHTGKKRCHACGDLWSARHPRACRVSCEDGEQFPTTKPGEHINVFGYQVVNPKRRKL